MSARPAPRLRTFYATDSPPFSFVRGNSFAADRVGPYMLKNLHMHVAKKLAPRYLLPMPKTATPSLTRREREIMDIVYRRGRATAHDVLADLAEPPSYSAVRALLRLLEERGHVRHVQEGQAYVYLPAVSRGDARKSALAHVVRTFFAGSIEQAVATLVESSRSKLSKDELDRLGDLIERAKKEGR